MRISKAKRDRVYQLLEAVLPAMVSQPNINVAGLTLEMLKTVDIIEATLANPGKASEQLEREQLLQLREQLAQNKEQPDTGMPSPSSEELPREAGGG